MASSGASNGACGVRRALAADASYAVDVCRNNAVRRRACLAGDVGLLIRDRRGTGSDLEKTHRTMLASGVIGIYAVHARYQTRTFGSPQFRYRVVGDESKFLVDVREREFSVKDWILRNKISGTGI